MTQVSNWIDIIEDIEEDPEAAQILSSYEGAFQVYWSLVHDLTSFVADACRTYELTWAIREASERSRAARLAASKVAATVFEEEGETE
jgi:hypothetical protein